MHASFASQVFRCVERVPDDVTEPLCLLVIDPRMAGGCRSSRRTWRVGRRCSRMSTGRSRSTPSPRSIEKLEHDADGWRWPGRA